MHKPMSLLAIAILIALFVVMGISVGYTAPKGPGQVVERHAERLGWKYKAALIPEEGRIGATVEYTTETVQQFQAMVAMQQQLARELITSGTSSLDVTVVFRRPLSQAEFEHFVTNTGLGQVSGYTLRYLDKQRQRVTINGAPDKGVLVPQDMLNAALNDLQQRAPGKLLGWVEVQAAVDPESYDTIVKDKNVFLVDVSRSMIRAAFKNDAAADRPIDLIAPQLYWKLEDLRLVSD